MGSAIPGLVVLGAIRKWAGPDTGDKPESSTLPWLLHPPLPPGFYPA